jgi:DNA-binding response OmpR family regulator
MSTRLLVIDDSELIREAATIGLAHAGWSVQTAADGATGLDLARASPPDAILLDLVMPDLSGAEVLRRLRADAATAAVPVILLTASAEEAAQHEPDGVIAKPFPPLGLAARVRAALGWTS